MIRRALLLSLIAAVATGQELVPHHQDRPPGPALSPEQAVKQMTVPEGFTVEVVASEPDIVNPVAMTFDERGRVWITESLEYPRKAPGPGRDRVKVLEDTDADGRADRFTVFAEGLNIPSGIAVGYGGVWVANSPDILFYPDADRDGRPDGQPQVVVTGFGRSDTHELPNSLTWGPDGYLYGLNGVFNHSHVRYAKENPNYKQDHPGWPITCAMFRIHPVTREFEVFCEGTSNPWGIAFDHEGSAFISACVIDHLWHLVRTGYYHRQGGPYPPFTWKIESIVKHKHQKAAYCGIHYFDSDAYPEPYRNKLYMGNIHGNCINVDKLQRDGSTYFATGEPDFLSANDAWFMPVVQKTGPDGCLWILDWYDRYHCYQDANRDPNGIDRLKGRLYRVRYKDAPRAEKFDLAAESNEQLLERLASGNGLMRDLAHRLLIERRVIGNGEANDSITAAAEKMIFDQGRPQDVRLRALTAVLALRAPRDALLMRLIADSNASFRAWAFRSIGNTGASDKVWQQVMNLSDETAPEAQLQLVIAAAKTNRSERVSLLVQMLAASKDDKLIPQIVWQNLHPLIGENPVLVYRELIDTRRPQLKSVAAIVPRVIERLLGRNQISDTSLIVGLFLQFARPDVSAGRETLKLLAARVQSGELKGPYLDSLKKAMQPSLAMLMTRDLGLKVPAATLAAAWGDSQAHEIVRSIIRDKSQSAEVRSQALSALVASANDKSKRQVVELAKELLIESGREDLQEAVLAALGKLDDEQVASVVISSFASLSPDSQPKAIELLTQRAGWARRLFAGIAAGQVNANLLNVNQLKRVLGFEDAELTAAVNKQFGAIRSTRDPAREQVVSQMRTLVRGIRGDPHRGIEVFNRVCGQCHKFYGQGQEVGPDITANGRASLEQLLSNVFDPSLVIGASYQARTIQASDGRILTGLLVEDSPERVVLKIQGGKLETVARADIDAMKVSELSLMPEGLEKQLPPQEIADLFAFISLDKHPDDPAARPIPSGADARR